MAPLCATQSLAEMYTNSEYMHCIQTIQPWYLGPQSPYHAYTHSIFTVQTIWEKLFLVVITALGLRS